MKKKINWIVLFMVVLMMQSTMLVKADQKYLYNTLYDSPKKIGNMIFTAKKQEGEFGYSSKIVMEKNGRSETILSNVNVEFATDGKKLYYSKPVSMNDDHSYKNAVCSYDINTGKRKKILSGKDYMVLGFRGKYVYCGSFEAAMGVKLYAVNVKTKKKTYMADCVEDVCISNGKVLTNTNTGSANNLPIHIFNLDGTGRKKVADGMYGIIKKGKVHYIRVDLKKWKFRVYECSLDGRNKKALTGWLDSVPENY